MRRRLLTPWYRFRRWLARDARSNRDAAVAGLVGTLLMAALSALLGVAVSAFDLVDFGGKLPAGLVFAAIAIGLLSGFLIGALITRWYYKPRLDEATETADLLPRIGVYASHLTPVLDSLPQRSFDELTKSLLGLARKCIQRATGQDVCFSIWTEELRENQPMLGLEYGPDHSEAERDAFCVPLENSWIAWAGKQSDDEKRLLGIPDTTSDAHLGQDLKAIQAAGYRTVRCFGIENDGPLVRFVALGREVDCMTPIEDEYIALLGLILTISRRLETLRQGDDPDGQSVVRAGT